MHETGLWSKYALEINDPYLAEFVRLADAGESIVEALDGGEISETLKFMRERFDFSTISDDPWTMSSFVTTVVRFVNDSYVELKTATS
jgi:hypothetical protein